MPHFGQWIRLILSHLASWGENTSLPMQKLSWKLAMLLSLCSSSCSSDLSKLCISHWVWSTHRVVFHPVGLAKQSRVGHLPTPIEFTEFENPLLCPIRCLRVWVSYSCSQKAAKSRPIPYQYQQATQSGGFLCHCSLAGVNPTFSRNWYLNSLSALY